MSPQDQLRYPQITPGDHTLSFQIGDNQLDASLEATHILLSLECHDDETCTLEFTSTPYIASAIRDDPTTPPLYVYHIRQSSFLERSLRRGAYIFITSDMVYGILQQQQRHYIVYPFIQVALAHP